MGVESEVNAGKRALVKRNGRWGESMSSNKKRNRSDQEAFKRLAITEARHFSKNQAKTNRFLKRHPNLVVKKIPQTFDLRDSHAPAAYEIMSFGNPKIDRFVSKLKALYRSRHKDLPKFELITNRTRDTYGTFDASNTTVYFSFAAMDRIGKGGLRTFIHEMRHAGNLDLLFKTDFFVNDSNRYRFNLKIAALFRTYKKYFSAEEINNHMRWHSKDQTKAMGFYEMLVTIHSEAKRRFHLVDDVATFESGPDVFVSKDQTLFESKTILMPKDFTTGLPEHYVTTLTLPNVDMESKIFVKRRRAKLYTPLDSQEPKLEIELRTFKDPRSIPIKRLADSINQLKELIDASEKLAAKRAPRIKP